MRETPLPAPAASDPEACTLTGPQAPTPARLAAVRALRALLAEGYGGADRPVASCPGPAPEALDGLRPDYDERVLPGLVAAQELAGVDVDCLRHVDAVSERGIAAASLADLGTLFSYVLRGEHYGPGHIRAAIANGKVARMLERLAELVPGLD